MSFNSILSTKKHEMNQYERNIIVGSLLGDGSLALYGKSKNAYYREHGCTEQLNYRLWKVEQLSRLDFKFDKDSKTGKIHSPSNPLYTDLQKLFYKNNRKVVTEENIKLLDHAIGLACWYMDDSTLIIDSTKRKDGSIYLFPRVSLYSLCFSKEENEIILNYLKNRFELDFKLKHRPDGKNYILEINKHGDLQKFIKLIASYVKQVQCMNYKIDIDSRMDDKISQLGNSVEITKVKTIDFNGFDNTYTTEEENQIINLKGLGITDRKIFLTIDRPYCGIVHIIRRLRKTGKIK